MPILREWRAEIRRAQSSEYVEYIRNTGLADYIEIQRGIWGR